MKKGDRVMVIAENAKHYEQKGTVDEVNGKEILIYFDKNPVIRVMYYSWNLSPLYEEIHPSEHKSIYKNNKPVDYFIICDNKNNKIGSSCIFLSLNDAINEAKSNLSGIYNDQTLYIYKCIGEVNSKVIKTTNSIIY